MSATPEPNAYQPPTADISPSAGAPLAAREQLYPTTIRKLALLFFCSMGFYPYYWMYQNWKRLAPERPEKISPFWRAFFFIFFTHELFREIHRRAGERKLATAWAPGVLATVFVAIEIANRVVGWISVVDADYAWLSLTQIFFLAAQCFPLAAVQRTVNELNTDPEGALNARYSVINILIIVAGALLYLLQISALGVAF